MYKRKKLILHHSFHSDHSDVTIRSIIIHSLFQVEVILKLFPHTNCKKHILHYKVFNNTFNEFITLKTKDLYVSFALKHFCSS